MSPPEKIHFISTKLRSDADFIHALLKSLDHPGITTAIQTELDKWTVWPADINVSVPLLWLATYVNAWSTNPKLVDAFTMSLAEHIDTLAASKQAVDEATQTQLGVGILMSHKMWTPAQTLGVVKAMSKTYSFDSTKNACRCMLPLALISQGQEKHAASIDSGKFKRTYYDTLDHVKKAPLALRIEFLPWLLVRDSFSIDASVIDATERRHMIALELVPENKALWDGYKALATTQEQWIKNTWYLAYGAPEVPLVPSFSAFMGL